MTIIHALKVRSHLQADQFERFCRERYLPALYTGSTRAGMLTGARMLRRRRELTSDPIEVEREFLLMVEWEGVAVGLPRVEDPIVQTAFEAFKVEATRLGGFDEIAEIVGEPL